jgi:hypothetical protein
MAEKNENTLRVESVDLHKAFQEMCSTAPLPWTRGPNHQSWSIVDANGDEVCFFDGSAPESPWLIGMILVAVNTCGGFKATRV